MAGAAAAKKGATRAYQGTRFGLGDEALDRTTKIPLSKCDKGMTLADWPKGEDGTERKIAGAYWEDDKCIARGRQGGKKVVLSAGIFINEGGYESDGSTNWPRNSRATRGIEGLHNTLILDIEKQSDNSHVLTVQKNVYRTLDTTPIKITISENNPKPGWTWKISETTEDQNLLWCVVELAAGKKAQTGAAEATPGTGVVTFYNAPTANGFGFYTVLHMEEGKAVPALIGLSADYVPTNQYVISKVLDAFPRCIANKNPNRNMQIPSQLNPIEEPTPDNLKEALNELKDSVLLFGMKKDNPKQRRKVDSCGDSEHTAAREPMELHSLF